MDHNELYVNYDSNNERRNSNVFINPAYSSTISINLQVESNQMTVRLDARQELDNLSYRETIRNSIQLPEALPRRKKRWRCKLLHKDHKEERMFVAYLLFISLFVMTFGSIGLSIILYNIPKFSADCWKLVFTSACLTMLVGAYICWEENICRPPRRLQ